MTDFGIARALDVDGMTTTGAVVGTSHYIAPEQAKGEQVELRVTSTGSAPSSTSCSPATALPGRQLRHRRHAARERSASSLVEKRPELPLRLVAAVERALEKDPAKRFPHDGRVRGQSSSSAASCFRAGGAGRDGDHPGAPSRKTGRWLPCRAGAPLAVAADRRDPGRIGAGCDPGRQLLFDDIANIARTTPGGSDRLCAIAIYDPPLATESTSTDPECDRRPPDDVLGDESYENLNALKPGVGIVFDACRCHASGGDRGQGFRHQYEGPIQTGSSRTDVTHIASQTLPINGTTTFRLVQNVPARYFMLWITQVVGRALVYEVKAR